MADNTTINTGSGGDTIATDDIGGVKFQRVKVVLGADGVNDGDISSSNALPVSDNGGSLTVDGTVAATQSGTWTVQPGNTANTTAWKVDGSAVTHPVSLASVPSHAVTNAGTFAVQVDGAALTALQLLDDAVFTDDSAFTPGTSKLLAGGFLADETGTDSVDEGDVGIARMTLDRKIHVAADVESSSMRISGVAVTPKFAAISGSTSGDNTLLAAVVSKKIRVIALFLVSAGTTTVRFESGAGGTGLTGVMSLVANTGFALPYNPAGWFETASNTLLNMELNAAVQVSGALTYIEV